MSKTNKWGSVYVLLSVNAAAKKNIFIWNNVSRFIMCLIILCVLLVVSEVIFLSSQSNWDWFQLSGQLIPLLPAHCCLRLLGFHSCCFHQDWDCCWNYTTYIFLRDWIQKKRKIVWGCLERWSCPWCWILSPGILETLVIHTACLNYTVWSQQLKNLYVRGHESSDMRNCVQGHEI